MNGPERVYAEREGRLREEAVRFEDEAHLRHVIDRIVSAVGRRVDESSPMVDARLPDGSRVNAVLPPLAVDGPLLTHPQVLGGRALDRHDGRHRQRAAGACRAARAGGARPAERRHQRRHRHGQDDAPQRTGGVHRSGRADRHGRGRRRAAAPTAACGAARGPAVEHRGQGEITVRALVRNALRMRPDRIVVGEVRGGEALDMLQAMNTGHDGSLTTVHASSPEDALRRIETMALMGGVDLPHAAIREQLQSARRRRRPRRPAAGRPSRRPLRGGAAPHDRRAAAARSRGCSTS